MAIRKVAGAIALFVAYSLALSGCGGGSAALPRRQNQPVNTTAAAGTAASSIRAVTPVPMSTPAFNDWATYQYDNQRDGYNPNSMTLTANAINAGKLRLVWSATLGDKQDANATDHAYE